MPYVMQICFNNSCRLNKRQYYFDYKGVQFKLIQNNPRKWSDVLISIIDVNYAPPSLKLEEDIFLKASEFLSALSWENNSLVKLWRGGWNGINKETKLRNIKCTVYDSPKIAYYSLLYNYGINSIPFIENEDQRIALYLYREAQSTNNIFLSFLFLWHILELNGNAVNWINKVSRKYLNLTGINIEDLSRINLGNKKLGEYLHNDCRNAVAHINGTKEGLKIKYDLISDNMRILISTKIITELARYFILNELALKKKFCLDYRMKFPKYKPYGN